MSLTNPQSVYLITYHANDKQFVDSLLPEQKQWLVNEVKQNKPSECMCCPCFAWEFGADKKITGFMCTIGGTANIEGIGQCI